MAELKRTPNRTDSTSHSATRTVGDIESVNRTWWPPRVAATHPGTTQKFKKDMARLASNPARYRYMFFAAPKHASGLPGPPGNPAWSRVACVGLHDYAEFRQQHPAWLKLLNQKLLPNAS